MQTLEGDNSGVCARYGAHRRFADAGRTGRGPRGVRIQPLDRCGPGGDGRRLERRRVFDSQKDAPATTKDGIPLDNPYWADVVNVAPGERYSVLMKMDTPGAWVWHCHILNHVEREDGMFGMSTAMVVS